MKISVIIPAFQAEKTIMRCLTSLLNQTYQNYEIIVVDDGSTDQTSDLLEACCQGHSTIQVIHQTNMGAMDARLNGMKIAKGEYILFLDSDDWLVETALESLSQIAITEKPDVILYHAYMVSQNQAYYTPMYTGSLEQIREDPLQAMFNREIGGFICGKMLRSSFIKENNINFPHQTSYGEDVAMFYSIFMHHPVISFCHDYLYFYVKRDKPIPDYCVDIIKSVEFIGECLKDNGIYERYKNDYQLLGTRYTIEIYNSISDNKALQRELWERYKLWNLRFLNEN